MKLIISIFVAFIVITTLWRIENDVANIRDDISNIEKGE